jgi:hypothetical protein
MEPVSNIVLASCALIETVTNECLTALHSMSGKIGKMLITLGQSGKTESVQGLILERASDSRITSRVKWLQFH